MENASKALIMAASVILGVLLFSVFVYVFRAGASLDETYDAAQIVRELNLFNSYFEVYDKNDNTIFDIITIANRAYSVNKDANYDETIAFNLVVQIGNNFYVIPNEKPPIPTEEDDRFGRNKIFKGTSDGKIQGNSFSIYNLVELSLDELGITGLGGPDDLSDKLSITKLGTAEYINASGVTSEKTNATIYKYLFERTDINYDSLGRIKYMKFKAVKNPNWDI